MGPPVSEGRVFALLTMRSVGSPPRARKRTPQNAMFPSEDPCGLLVIPLQVGNARDGSWLRMLVIRSWHPTKSQLGSNPMDPRSLSPKSWAMRTRPSPCGSSRVTRFAYWRQCSVRCRILPQGRNGRRTGMHRNPPLSALDCTWTDRGWTANSDPIPSFASGSNKAMESLALHAGERAGGEI
jgi:hypothetical protein